jgi:hypothetical protein
VTLRKLVASGTAAVTRRVIIGGIVAFLAFAGAATALAAGVVRTDASSVVGLAGKTGCYGQTDQPHPSSHKTGTVNVVARTVCPGHRVYVSTDLYRSRWYGWQLQGSGSKSGSNSVSDNAADNGCGGIHNYLAESYHEASGVGTAYTANSANNLPCHR